MERQLNNPPRSLWKRLSLRSRMLLVVVGALLGWQMFRVYTVWNATKQLRRLNVNVLFFQPDSRGSTGLFKEIDRVVILAVNVLEQRGGSDWSFVAQNLFPGRGGVYVSIGSAELRSGRMPEIIDQLVRLGTVQSLYLSGSVDDAVFTQEGFRQISRLKSLKSLSMNGDIQYSVDNVKPLADLPRLERISLDGSYALYNRETLQFFLSIRTIKSIGLPQPSPEEQAFVKGQRPDISLYQTDCPP